MELVDEEDNAPLGFFHLIEHGLQPLLKLSPVLGPGHQCPHVQGEDGLVLQGGGDISLDDPLGQALGNGGFAHAGLPDENGIVFGFPGEDADDVADLVVPADHRVQLVLPGPLHQVGAVLFQGAVGLLGVIRGHPLVSPYPGQGLEGPLPGDLVLGEELGQLPPGGVQEPQEEVLHGGIFVFHLSSHFFRPVQGLFRVTRDVDFSRLMARIGDPGLTRQQVFHRGLKRGYRHPHPGQQLGNKPLAVLQQGPEQVDLLNLGIAVFQGNFLGRADGFGGFLG